MVSEWPPYRSRSLTRAVRVVGVSSFFDSTKPDERWITSIRVDPGDGTEEKLDPATVEGASSAQVGSYVTAAGDGSLGVVRGDVFEAVYEAIRS